MNKRLSHVLQPRFRLCFICLILFAIVTFFIQPVVAIAEVLVVVAVYLIFIQGAKKRNKEVLKYVENMMFDITSENGNSMSDFPLPVAIIRLDSSEILWHNSEFMSMTGAQDRVFETYLRDILPEFDLQWALEGKGICPTEQKIGEKYYNIFANRIKTNDSSSVFLTLYWVDVTDRTMLMEKFTDTRQIVSLIVVDNYDELTKGADESARSSIMAGLDSRISAWISNCHGMLLKLERDKYVFIFENRYLNKLREDKFSILESVRDVVGNNGMRATVSVGIGKDGESFEESYNFAQLAIDMSLSRGGDQAVIRDKLNFEFFGGLSKELEKRTKVKSRVMANSLAELIKDSSNVLIMGHKNADNDSLGAALGLMCIVRKYGKTGNIVFNKQQNTAESLYQRIKSVPEYENVFISAEDAILDADSKTLLIVVDTNRPIYVESQAILESVNKVAVIDHHRRAAEYIENALLNFHEPYASSACELVSELLQYLVDATDLLKCEAEALLSGIVLDSKNFTLKTGVRTFEAAAFLRSAGADTIEIKRLFQNDLQSYVKRADIVKMVKMYREDIAIAIYDGESDRTTAAQAADELLNITKIKASFVIFRAKEFVCISARSLGEINVQIILEKLGGGGHLATAGAQIKNAEIDQVYQDLINAINEVIDEE